MDPVEQLELVREFMLAVAPAVTTAHLDQGGYTPAETAKTTLELAMHLASQFALVEDTYYDATPENAPKENPIKARLQKDAPAEARTASPNPRV